MRDTAPVAPSPRTGTRPEIQALRAIAVGLVVAYHLHPPAVPGGYVGVDVFFVISGFLISRHLLSEAARTGRVDLAAFWAGRVRRILPAALVTTVAVVTVAMLALPRIAAAEIGRTGLWAALSAVNWLFAADSVDYQAQSPSASPFEHFWSLGVEEQFYLVWPFLVLLAAAAARRRMRQVNRLVLVPFGFVLVASLAFGVWFTASGSPAAYFITPTRMWELAAGGLLAALLGDRQPRVSVAAVLQLGGLAAIVAGAALLDSRTPMPGVAAVLPVAGAVAFIAGGRVPVLDRVWTFRPTRWIGDTSYSLYLWHWPVIVFARDLTQQPIGFGTGAIVLVTSLVLSTASYLLIEQPLRRIRIRRPLRVIAVGAAAITVVAGIGTVPVARNAVLEGREAAARSAVLHGTPGPAIGFPQLDAAADRTWAREPHVVVPAASTLSDDVAFSRCTIQPLSTTSPICVVGDRSSTTTVAVVGDSHMRQWGDVLDQLGRERHWRIVTILHNSCPFNLVPRPLEVDGQSRCTQAVRWTLPVLRAQHVQVMLTSAYRKSYRTDQLQAAADGYTSMWRTLEQQGIRVLALGDTPTPPTPVVADCVVAHDPATCGSSKAQAESVTDPLRLAQRKDPSVPFIDPVSAFCGTTWCPGVIGNVAVYADDNHATDTYLRTAMPWVRDHIGAAVAQQLAHVGT